MQDYWASRDEGGEDVDQVFGRVDGFRGDGVERFTAAFEQNSSSEACGEAGGEVFIGTGHCASELDGGPIPTIARGGEDSFPRAWEQFQRVEIEAQFKLSGEIAPFGDAHAAFDAGETCRFDDEICEREVSQRPFKVGAEFLERRIGPRRIAKKGGCIF